MKTEIRKKLRLLRSSCPDKQERSEAIESILINSELFKNADTVLLYCSTGDEVSTDKLFDACLEAGKKTAFPRCLDSEGSMEFYLVKDKGDLEKGMYGIVEPKKECELIIPDSKALCVVPGIAFDKRGFRMGYGKGYYDRYLGRYPILSVGLTYTTLLCDELPYDSFDQRVCYIITEKNIFKTNDKEDLKNG